MYLKVAFGKNDKDLKTCNHIPIWIHRQAGRYMSEFRALRKKHDFFTICQTPALACEATLQPINTFDLDASIIFSDILVIPQIVGFNIEMQKEKGPVFTNPLEYPKDANLQRINQNINVKQSLDYVYKAITLTRHALQGKVPLIGFTGGPLTLAAYSIEGC